MLPLRYNLRPRQGFAELHVYRNLLPLKMLWFVCTNALRCYRLAYAIFLNVASLTVSIAVLVSLCHNIWVPDQRTRIHLPIDVCVLSTKAQRRSSGLSRYKRLREKFNYRFTIIYQGKWRKNSINLFRVEIQTQWTVTIKASSTVLSRILMCWAVLICIPIFNHTPNRNNVRYKTWNYELENMIMLAVVGPSRFFLKTSTFGKFHTFVFLR